MPQVHDPKTGRYVSNKGGAGSAGGSVGGARKGPAVFNPKPSARINSSGQVVTGKAAAAVDALRRASFRGK